MLQACHQFAVELNRPELANAYGSLGSLDGWAGRSGFRAVLPPAGFWPFTLLFGATQVLRVYGGEGVAALIPALYLMGEEDRKPKDIWKHFLRARRNESPRAWILLPGQGHWPKGVSSEENKTTAEDWRAWAANDIVIPWAEAIIQLRLAESVDPKEGSVKLRNLRIQDGWLGDISTGRIAAYNQFEGEKSTASWFPTEGVAKAWAKFSFPDGSSKGNNEKEPEDSNK